VNTVFDPLLRPIELVVQRSAFNTIVFLFLFITIMTILSAAFPIIPSIVIGMVFYRYVLMEHKP
jgi:hypothetical protein